MVRSDVVEHAPGEAAEPRRGAHHGFTPARLHLRHLRKRRLTPLFAIGLLFVSVVSIAFGPDITGTQALFVAVIRNAGNTFGVPAILAPTGIGATPQPSGGIRVQWSEPGASSVAPVATSWAGAYLIYRSDSPATPAADATAYATVLSSGGATGAFVDGGLVNGQACSGPACPVNNTRYFYWVRALSRQTGFPSPFISATVSAASDATPPQVLSISPGSSAVAVPLGTNVQVTFSEPVDFDAAVAATCIAPTSSPSSCVAITGNQSRWAKSSGVLLEVKPSARLTSNTAYGVSFIASGTSVVRDLAGNAMAATPANSASSFTTETPAGTVSIRWRSPAVDSQEYMPASGPVVALTFAEPMDQASTAAAFELFAGAGCTGTPIPVTASWNASSSAVAFSPPVGTPLSVGLMASPTFGVYTYSMRFNEPTVSGKSAAGFPGTAISCANGTFVPSASVLGFDLADVPSGASIAEPMVVAGESLVLKSVSGPWRQGSYTTLKSTFDEPRTSNLASGTFAIGGDSWSGLPIMVPADAAGGRHFIGVQNDAIAANVGQDVRTAFRAVTVVDPTITVATFSASDTSESAPRTVMSPKSSVDGDTVRFRVQVTAPSRDGNGVRPVTGLAVRLRAVVNPVGYGARLCTAPTNLVCASGSTDLSLTTDSQGVIRGFLTAPQAGAPFNTIVLLASAGTEWGSVVLTDPAPSPPADLRYTASTGRFSWSASPTVGVAGYRVRLVPVGGGVDIVIDAGLQLSVGIPEGALVASRSYRASVMAYDASGRTSSSSSEIDFVAPAPTPTATPTATAVATATSSATFVVTATVIATPATVITTPSAATATSIAALASVTVTPVATSAGGSATGPAPTATAEMATATPTGGLAVGITATPGSAATSVGTPVSGALLTTPAATQLAPTSVPGSTAAATIAPPTATTASATAAAASTPVPPNVAAPTQIAPTIVPPTQVPPTVAAASTPVPPGPTSVPASTSVPVAPTTAPPAPTTAPSAGVLRPDGGATW